MYMYNNSKLLTVCLVFSMSLLSNNNISYCMERIHQKYDNKQINEDVINNNEPQQNDEIINELNKYKQQYKECIAKFNKIYKQLNNCWRLFAELTNRISEKISNNIENTKIQIRMNYNNDTIGSAQAIKKYINDFNNSITMNTLQQFKNYFEDTMQTIKFIKIAKVSLLNKAYNSLLNNVNGLYNDSKLNDDARDAITLQIYMNDFKNMRSALLNLSDSVNTTISELQRNTCKIFKKLKYTLNKNKPACQLDAEFWAYACLRSFGNEISELYNNIHMIEHLTYYNENIFESE